MKENKYKKYTLQARLGIKGEAFFESLISQYALPHRIVGSKDLGLDFICEWVNEEKPTNILFVVQVKSFLESNCKIECLGKEEKYNRLEKFKITNSNLIIDAATLEYWRGFGLPTYLFAVILEKEGHTEKLNCYYKRFTYVLTKNVNQKTENFYKVNDGDHFKGFADESEKKFGFARDLYIDYMRWNYHKGSITYLNPREIGLNQFPEEGFFKDLYGDYKENLSIIYTKMKTYLEQ